MNKAVSTGRKQSSYISKLCDVVMEFLLQTERKGWANSIIVLKKYDLLSLGHWIVEVATLYALLMLDANFSSLTKHW